MRPLLVAELKLYRMLCATPINKLTSGDRDIMIELARDPEIQEYLEAMKEKADESHS